MYEDDRRAAMPGLMGLDAMLGIQEVEVEGKKIPVQNGIAMFNGQPYFIPDGKTVLDQRRQVVGSVRNGKFVPNAPPQQR
jgi:hypothetical protein